MDAAALIDVTGHFADTASWKLEQSCRPSTALTMNESCFAYPHPYADPVVGCVPEVCRIREVAALTTWRPLGLRPISRNEGLEWDASRQPGWLTSEVFVQQIQPLLANIPTAAIRSRLGVSRWYAGKIRQGYRPHPRHWQALAELAGVSANA
ncbi:MAG: hypothetical protein ABSD89_13200 [Halobacteriota archaeon]|jgi:hypothetical protein